MVDNREIRNLNRKYRGVNRATDVLAFSQREGEFKKISPGLLGDIVISLPQAKIQARALGHSFKEEMAVLIIHGILHLLGYDDGNVNQRKRMFVKQEQLMNWLKKEKI